MKSMESLTDLHWRKHIHRQRSAYINGSTHPLVENKQRLKFNRNTTDGLSVAASLASMATKLFANQNLYWRTLSVVEKVKIASIKLRKYTTKGHILSVVGLLALKFSTNWLELFAPSTLLNHVNRCSPLFVFHTNMDHCGSQHLLMTSATDIIRWCRT